MKKPKLFLHFGMPKAGSNALQMLFHQRRDFLLSRGILYPTSALGSEDRHHHLTIPTFGGVHLPTAFRKLSKEEALKEFDVYWEDLKDQISEKQPEAVILSTEALYRPLDDKGIETLRGLMSEISSEIRLVAFIRQLPSYFLSLVQQRVLSTGSIPPMPTAAEIMHALLTYEVGFGADTMTVFPYENGRDVVVDFCTLLEDYGVTRDDLGELEGRANQSLSSAALYLLMSYKQNPPQKDPTAAERSGNVLGRLLKDLDTELGMSRPSLKSSAYAAIAPEGYVLEGMLAQRYGLVFQQPTSLAGLSGEDMASSLSHADELDAIRGLTDVRPDNVDALLTALAATDWPERHPALAKWVRRSQKRASADLH
ncbi:hypothetical protein [Roseovarius indicus]|uniref:hypothetical protein n=1 Tax=Roseovarius indicus TaxID=540747 RepID=UPI0007DA0813|nr:hypothetical protein [Roseovarius indicus]OAO05722.1 hypothetical protein A8B76_10055 [Roseovarius indicus]